MVCWDFAAWAILDGVALSFLAALGCVYFPLLLFSVRLLFSCLFSIGAFSCFLLECGFGVCLVVRLFSYGKYMVDIVVVGDYVIAHLHFIGQCVGVSFGFCRRNVASRIIFRYGVRMFCHHVCLA